MEITNKEKILLAEQSLYVVTRSEEHSDYVEKVFIDEEKAEAYCAMFNNNEDCYRRNITEMKVTS